MQSYKCWKQWEEELDMHAFAFVPYWATLFVCQFLDPNQQMIGFDVYGGKSGKRGKKNFYYSIRNDGIYYGDERGEENELIQRWDTPCVDSDEEDMMLADSSVPTGTSSVPAADCGKRIVGYYTGWGTREATVDQIRLLTHVIFAFVATYPDGSIGFGAVSDEPNQDDAVQAEQRFTDLRRKARIANAGVKIFFAVGGWGNSQHFSTIAADRKKRAKFVDQVADFLRNQRIDGIDIDWEYPVTGGAKEGVPADKQNYILLLKELRERLTKLATELDRDVPYEITIASAAGEWNIKPGYDLKSVTQYVDFINVMTYDYYGAWGSQWGAYTGPPSPLYYGAPSGYSGKLNADFSMKYYTCRTGKPSKLNMGVPFYG
ncbi:glycosyl hydrolase, family 18, partial [Ancylostoma duodenale]